MWDLGCGLFQDHKTGILYTDARDWCDPRGKLGEIQGKVDVVLMDQLFDLFHWHDPIDIGRTIVKLSHVGTNIIDRTLGVNDRRTCEYGREGHVPPDRCYHDVSSKGVVWFDIGRNTQPPTFWNLEVATRDFNQRGLDQNDIAWLDEEPPNGVGSPLKALGFVIERVS